MEPKVAKLLTFADRYGISSAELGDFAGRSAGRTLAEPDVPGDNSTHQNSVSRLFNVFVTRKERAKKMQQEYFTVEVPEGEDEHALVRAYVREHYSGWLLGGYAPAKLKPNDSES